MAILAPNMPEAHFARWGAEVAGRACPITPLLNVEHIAALGHASGARVIVARGPRAELDIWPTRRSGPPRGTGLRSMLVAPAPRGTNVEVEVEAEDRAGAVHLRIRAGPAVARAGVEPEPCARLAPIALPYEIVRV